jgi:hypothetical protein
VGKIIGSQLQPRGTVGMRRFQVVLLIVFALMFGGGLARLLLDSPPVEPVTMDRALEWASCLASAEVPAGVSVTLIGLTSREPPLSEAVKPSLVHELNFLATEPVPVMLADPEIRARVEKGEPVPLLEGSEFRVSKGEFRLQEGTIEAQWSGGRYLLQARDRLRFGPTESTDYIVKLTEEVTVGGTDETGKPRKPELPVGTKGLLWLGINQPVTLVPLQPLIVKPWLLDIASTLLPERASGEKGLGNVTIEVRRPGLRFDSADLLLSACASPNGGGAKQVGVAEVHADGAGAATVLLSLSNSVLPVFSLWTQVELALASSDGQYLGHGGFAAVGRGWAAIIATLLTGLFLWWLSNIRSKELGARSNDWARWLTSLFIGGDGDPSLSLFQVFFWTVITAWGFIYTFTVTGSLLGMTTEMMALLGIAGAGSVAARLIATRRAPVVATSASAAAPMPQAPVAASTLPANDALEFWQILSTDGRFDLLKLQLFAFTLLIGVYVVWRLIDTAAFPTLDVNTLLLMGVSQSVYIGGKLAATTGLGRAQTLKLELDVSTSALTSLTEEKKTLEAEKAAVEQQGGSLPIQKQARLDALPGEIRALETKVAELKGALEKAVKEIGLTAT